MLPNSRTTMSVRQQQQQQPQQQSCADDANNDDCTRRNTARRQEYGQIKSHCPRCHHRRCQYARTYHRKPAIRTTVTIRQGVFSSSILFVSTLPILLAMLLAIAITTSLSKQPLYFLEAFSVAPPTRPMVQVPSLSVLSAWSSSRQSQQQQRSLYQYQYRRPVSVLLAQQDPDDNTVTDDKTKDGTTTTSRTPRNESTATATATATPIATKDAGSVTTTEDTDNATANDFTAWMEGISRKMTSGSSMSSTSNTNNKRLRPSSNTTTTTTPIDIFKTVDRLLKVFEKQEAEREQEELFQLTTQLKLEDQFFQAGTGSLTSTNNHNDDNNKKKKKKKKKNQVERVNEEESSSSENGISDVTTSRSSNNSSSRDSNSKDITMEDLMALQQYVGKLLFQKDKAASSKTNNSNNNKNVWDAYSRSFRSSSSSSSSSNSSSTQRSPPDDKFTTIHQNENENENSTILNSEDKDTHNDNTENDSFTQQQVSVVKENQENIDDETENETNDGTIKVTQKTVETMVKDTTARLEFLVAEALEYMVAEASTALDFSPEAAVLNSTIRTAATTTARNSSSSSTVSTTIEALSNELVTAAQNLAKESGADINNFANDRAREATAAAATANVVLNGGYAYGSRSGATGVEGKGRRGDTDLNRLAAQTAAASLSSTSSLSSPQPQQQLEPLFGQFSTARRVEPYEYDDVVTKGSEMASLAGAIYDASTCVSKCHELGHSFVANGTTADVAWMITDTMMDVIYTPSYNSHYSNLDPDGLPPAATPSVVMARTITIRGFDASDESVDREALLNNICSATSVSMNEEEEEEDPDAVNENDDTATAVTARSKGVVFHEGLLSVAKEIYADTKKYIDWMSPNHKLVLNGHSVGGSLSVLILLLITNERGVDYVRDRILRVYTHGCPPIATAVNATGIKQEDENIIQCNVLEAFELPTSMVYAYIQPYDPVIRLFSGDHDVLYPLVDDLGTDGVTLYSTGPIRSLRPITRAIFSAWNGWPQFRDNWKGTSSQQYQSIGIQHLLLPEPLRYLNDRFISVNVGVPPLEAVVRISPEQLLSALDETFPLDTFQVSLVPQAVRSFLHHFYPAYDSSLADYLTKIQKDATATSQKKKMRTRKKSGSVITTKKFNAAFKPFKIKQSE